MSEKKAFLKRIVGLPACLSLNEAGLENEHASPPLTVPFLSGFLLDGLKRDGHTRLLPLYISQTLYIVPTLINYY